MPPRRSPVTAVRVGSPAPVVVGAVGVVAAVVASALRQMVMAAAKAAVAPHIKSRSLLIRSSGAFVASSTSRTSAPAKSRSSATSSPAAMSSP